MQQQRGFTLIEMMLALAIFALLSLTGYSLLQGMMRNGEQTRQHVTRLEETGRLFALLERDLAQAMIPARNPMMAAVHPAFLSDMPPTVLQFTRRNGTLPAEAGHRSSLQRVRWRLEDDILLRELPDDNEITARFHAIDRLTLRYWSAGGWHDSWPAAFTLPLAIEVTLHTADKGELVKVILLSGGQ
jgi:general secretion pathway protein J